MHHRVVMTLTSEARPCGNCLRATDRRAEAQYQRTDAGPWRTEYLPRATTQGPQVACSVECFNAMHHLAWIGGTAQTERRERCD